MQRERRWGFSLSSCLPPPHRLGASAGLKPRPHTTPPHLHPTTSEETVSQLSIGADQTGPPSLIQPTDHHLGAVSDSGEDGRGLEGTDSGGPPPTKRPKRQPFLARRVTQVRLQTHDGDGLDEFVLFLPPKLPRVIVHSRSALKTFVFASLRQYLDLWELAYSLKVVDLHFPPPYSQELCEEYDFIAELLTEVSQLFIRARAIEKFCLPRITFHTCAQLDTVLKPLARPRNARGSIAQLLLPLQCSLSESKLGSLNYSSLVETIRKIAPGRLCLVSSDSSVSVLKTRLQAELAKSRGARSGGTRVTVEVASPDVIASSLSYLGESESPSESIRVDPHSLVDSLNIGKEGESEGGRLGDLTRKGVGAKAKAKGAYSTDLTYSGDSEVSSSGPYPSDIWNLERLHDRGIDGTGTTIAIIDSGISFMHAAFKGRIIDVRNFVPSEVDNLDCAIDSDGHGTLCAGIAAGQSFHCPQSSDDPTSLSIRIPPGVAPGARLVVCKVVGTTTGSVDGEAFLSALKWLKSLHTSGQRIDVVSISLASTYYSWERSQVISELTGLGVVVVCCASNVGRLSLQPISFPARLGHVICIGAHDENGKPTSFSPVGREMDFLAPGQDVWGPGPGTKSPFAMDCASGTSCAAPAVAGLVCLVLQAVAHIYESDRCKFCIGGRPLVDVVRSVWVMRELLKEMSSSPGHHSEEIGYGTLNPYRLLDRGPEELLRMVDEIVDDE